MNFNLPILFSKGKKQNSPWQDDVITISVGQGTVKNENCHRKFFTDYCISLWYCFISLVSVPYQSDVLKIGPSFREKKKPSVMTA